MTTYFVQTTTRGTLSVRMTKPDLPHYVVKAPDRLIAIDMVKAYRIGYIWATEAALSGAIKVAS